jgi:cobalt-precorrin-5B (C1)-methyltransferase
VESKSKKLRSGYTTGACAAAAAKAAAMLLVRSLERIDQVEIPFPDGSRVKFKVQSSEFRVEGSKRIAAASIVKDAGDDPDVTNGAEIIASVQSTEYRVRGAGDPDIIIKGGLGIGIVTKPGLAIPVGEAAINPVPLRMIREAVREALSETGLSTPQSAIRNPQLEITISVPTGEALAKKTLNRRLGIVGGISILGTTGIVRPVSTAAYTASITASLDVAKAAGLDAVVLSSGRTSEKAHMKRYQLPEEAYVMMGDYVEYALVDAAKHGFSRVHFCAQWAKLVKTAMGTPQTHVRHGALEAGKARDFLINLGIDIPPDRAFNTTREVYDFIHTALRTPRSALVRVCKAAKEYAERIASDIPVDVHLVSYEGDILATSE